jgi:hypothetical protein
LKWLVDKASGAPFLGRFFAGMLLGVHPDEMKTAIYTSAASIPTS